MNNLYGRIRGKYSRAKAWTMLYTLGIVSPSLFFSDAKYRQASVSRDSNLLPLAGVADSALEHFNGIMKYMDAVSKHLKEKK